MKSRKKTKAPMPVPSKEGMLRLILAVAKKAGVKIAIGGGLAVNAHGFRRETDDVDAFFHYDDQRKVLRSLNQLAPDYFVEQIDPSQWMAIPPGAEPNERIDLLFASGDPEESAIEMTEPRNYHGIEAPVFPADLLVISKFLAERDEAKDVMDIYTLHKRGAFDIETIIMRLHQMGLDEDAKRFPEFMAAIDALIARKRG
jgi:hypothetical protein